MEKISVIIPIYKVEKYLERCINSVVNQTYENLEIILVDDGSPDDCPRICDKWAEKDERIIVVHKENGGLSDARNAGMKVMTGDYVFFVDSDDWIHKDTIRILKQYEEKHGVDIVECKAQVTSGEVDEASLEADSVETKVYNTAEAMAALLRDYPLRQTVWNKLYRKDVVEGVLFEVGKYHEDEFWTYQVIDRAEKILYVDVELYYYFQRSDSIMGQAFSIKRLDAVEGRYRRLGMLQDKYPELVSEAKENLVFLIMYLGQQAVRSDKMVKDEFFTRGKNFLNRIAFTQEEIRQYAKTHQVWITGAIQNLVAICKIRNWLKIGNK